MIRIAYISTALPSFSDDALGRLVLNSSRFNAQNHISGVLLCNMRNFLQILEGPADVLDPLMARISSDARHEGVKEFLRIKTERRWFSQWSMRLIRLHDDRAARDRQIDALLPAGLDHDTSVQLRNFAALN